MKSSHLLNGVKNHYQWIIAVTTFLILFLSMGLGNSASGQYISIVTSDLGFSRGSFSLVISLRFIFMGIVSATIGLLTRYISLKNLISIGFGLMAVVHFAFSKAYSIYAFYLFGCFWGIALALASLATSTQLINNWFIKRRGLILGIVFAGSGLGGSAFNFLVPQWINKLGWRTSYSISGWIFLIAGIFFFFLLRSEPTTVREVEDKTINLDPKFKASKVNGFSLKEAVRKPDFYFFIVFAILMGMLNNPIYTAAPSVMRDQKFSETFMSMIISLLFLILAVAKVVIGFLYDKYGAQIVLTICLLFNFLGILSLSNLDTNIKAFIFSVALGISIPLETLVIPMIVMEFFGNKDAITLNGIFFSCVTLGIALGNPIVNFFYDLNGSYGGVFRVFALISIVCLVTISIAFSKNKSVNKAEQFGIVEGE